MANKDKKSVIGSEECIKDSTFMQTDALNSWIGKNETVHKMLLAWSSILLDSMVITFMIVWTWKL